MGEFKNWEEGHADCESTNRNMRMSTFFAQREIILNLHSDDESFFFVSRLTLNWRIAHAFLLKRLAAGEIEHRAAAAEAAAEARPCPRLFSCNYFLSLDMRARGSFPFAICLFLSQFSFSLSPFSRQPSVNDAPWDLRHRPACSSRVNFSLARNRMR